MSNGYLSGQLATYQIRVKGDLTKWSAWFDGLIITPQADGETVLTGTVIDQRALHGILVKIRDLGLPLLCLRVAETACSGNE